MEPAEGLGRRLEPDRLGTARVDPGGGERRGAVERPEPRRWPGRQPGQGRRGVEDVLQDLPTGLPQQRMIRARRLDEREQPGADPEQPTNPGPAPFGPPEDHQGRRRDVAEPAGEQLAPVEPIEHVVPEPLHREQAQGSVRGNTGSWLMGLLYDDRGNRMTPSSARKGALRYRYYVSRALETGQRGEAGSVPRVSAPEIEQAVREALTSTATPGRTSSSDETSLLAQVSRIVVHPSCLTINFVEPDEAEHDGRAGGAGSTEPSPLNVPWSARPSRRRCEVIRAEGDEGPAPPRPMRVETRARLVDGIAKARFWLDDLVSGRVADTHAIAVAEGCSERSVRMTLNLAFLAPSVIQAAIAGILPEGAGISALMNAPIAWSEYPDACGGNAA